CAKDRVYGSGYYTIHPYGLDSW
nr:immunoglobulin heavy chain junction region [Macaca mulatta]